VAVGISAQVAYFNRQPLSVVVGTGNEVAEPGFSQFSMPDFSIVGGYADRENYLSFQLNNVFQRVEEIPTYLELNYQYKYRLDGIFSEDYLRPSITFGYYLGSGYFQQIGGLANMRSVIFGLYESGGGGQIISQILGLAGYEFYPYSVYYSYAANVNNFSVTGSRNGVHEVTFLLELQYNGKRTKRGAIKCPDI